MSLLDYLRKKTVVDCDTLDANVPKEMGGFVDCTSNQAIAYGELLKPHHQSLLIDSLSVATKLHPKFSSFSLYELATYVAQVKLSILILPHITGRVHTQTNPLDSFSTARTVDGARIIVELYHYLLPNITMKEIRDRVCIKVPSTWEGLKACEILEAEDIRTLATTLFTIEQAVVAAEAGCRYIAPYVNVLKVHFTPGYIDTDKAFDLCVKAQRYYRKHKYATQVLPASLTSTTEILQIAGADHITISPGLLTELARVEHSPSTVVESLFDRETEKIKKMTFIEDESGFRMVMNRSNDGRDAAKLVEAINIFSDFQEKIEKIFEELDKSREGK
ncbi:hypothetical protein RUND412_004931 [Rhizina undulata]